MATSTFSFSNKDKLEMYRELLAAVEGNTEEQNAALGNFGSNFPTYKHELMHSEGEEVYKYLDQFRDKNSRSWESGNDKEAGVAKDVRAKVEELKEMIAAALK